MSKKDKLENDEILNLKIQLTNEEKRSFNLEQDIIEMRKILTRNQQEIFRLRNALAYQTIKLTEAGL